MKDRVQVFDTTLRDGEQSPGASMTIADKMMLAHQLERLHVDVIEAGFPISSEGDFESVRSIAKEIQSPAWQDPARGISIVAGRLFSMLKNQEFMCL